MNIIKRVELVLSIVIATVLLSGCIDIPIGLGSLGTITLHIG